MPKWKIVVRQHDSADSHWSHVDIVNDYGNRVLKQHGIVTPCRAIRIHHLVSIAGKTYEEWGFTEDCLMGEYNGSGFHFIRIRDDVTLDDFEIEVIE
jgi:hypothetical protein